MTKIKYVLKIVDEINDEILYMGEFYSEEALQEEGLRKADKVIKNYEKETKN